MSNVLRFNAETMLQTNVRVRKGVLALQIGAILKKYRTLRRMTQVELAQRSGLTQGYISKIERGERISITLESLQALAKGLELPLVELLRELDERDEQTPLVDTEALFRTLREAGFTAKELETVGLFLHALKPEAVPLHRWWATTPQES